MYIERMNNHVDSQFNQFNSSVLYSSLQKSYPSGSWSTVLAPKASRSRGWKNQQREVLHLRTMCSMGMAFHSTLQKRCQEYRFGAYLSYSSYSTTASAFYEYLQKG